MRPRFHTTIHSIRQIVRIRLPCHQLAVLRLSPTAVPHRQRGAQPLPAQVRIVPRMSIPAPVTESNATTIHVSSNADVVASLVLPPDELHVSGPAQIWRAHSAEKAASSSDFAAAAAAVAASSDGAAASSAVAPRVHPLPPLDKAQFNQSITVVAFRIPAKQCGVFQQHFRARAHLLHSRPRIGTIIDGPSKDMKYLLLSATSLEEVATYPRETLEFALQTGARAALFTFSLGYDYFSTDHILRQLLPPNIVVPGGFETVGHIAHLNLSEEQRPYGGVIARVILDKNPHLHTIINKLSSISSEFRVFPMEILGGLDSFVTEVKEHGCTFRMDFSKVYWNSRLSTEHTRLIDLFKPNELIVDLCCGIGPFVVPAAKQLGHQKNFLRGQPALFANDLNPDSYSSLCTNLQLNKVAALVQPWNLDAREFLWKVLRPIQLGAKAEGKQDGKDLQSGAVSMDSVYRGVPVKHFVMNLPAIAIELLDAFVGLYLERVEDTDEQRSTLERLRSQPLPLVHVYCFSHNVTHPAADLVPRIQRALGGRSIPEAVVVREEPGSQKGKPSTHPAHKKGKQEKHSKLQQQKTKAAGDYVAMEVEEPGVSSAAACPTAFSSAAPASIPSLPPLGQTHIRFVRNVAPSKDMFCVSFHMPMEVLVATPTWWDSRSVPAVTAQGNAAMEVSAASSESSSSTAGKRKAPDEITITTEGERTGEEPAKKQMKSA